MQRKNSWTDIRRRNAGSGSVLCVTDDELCRAGAMSCPSRREEWLLWRSIVRQHLGADVCIEYDACGAPVLPGKGVHIGVSHCRLAVAVVCSPEPCAVDVECLDRNFHRVAARYITEQERLLEGAQEPLFEAAVWCAKEAAYKYIGMPSAEFLRDIIVERCMVKQSRMEVRISDGRLLQVDLARDSELMLAVIGAGLPLKCAGAWRDAFGPQ